MASSNYADFGDSELVLVPQRTSILAIFSLICALICIIPGLGVLATIFGIAAIVGISGSKGRVGGTGLAATGIILGLLFSMVWVGMIYGGGKVASIFVGGFAQPTADALMALDNDKITEARAGFTTAANAAITDEELIKFRDAYQADLGVCKGSPTNLVEFIRGYQEAGKAFKNVQGPSRGPSRQDMIPMPINFEKGKAIVIAVFDPKGMDSAKGGPASAPGTPGFKVPLSNIIILTTGGKQYSIKPDAMTTLPAGSTTGSETTTPDPTPSAGAEPESEESPEPATDPTHAPSTPKPPK